MRQSLHRLAQSHIVGQDPAELDLAQELQPVQALLLIRAQLGLQAIRRRNRSDFADPAQLPADLEQARAAKPAKPGGGRGRFQLRQFSQAHR